MSRSRRMFSPPCARTNDLTALWYPSQSDVVLSPLWLMPFLMQSAHFSASHALLFLHNLTAYGKSYQIAMECCQKRTPLNFPPLEVPQEAWLFCKRHLELGNLGVHLG
jgi:hypothetical protein